MSDPDDPASGLVSKLSDLEWAVMGVREAVTALQLIAERGERGGLDHRECGGLRFVADQAVERAEACLEGWHQAFRAAVGRS